MGASHEATSRQYRLLSLASCRRISTCQARRGRRPRHGRPPVRRGHARPRHRGGVADHRAGRGGRRRIRPGRSHRIHRALGPRPARAARQRLRGRRARSSCGSAPGSPRSTGPPRPSSPRTANASTTTRWCWPPAPTPSCRRCRATTCRGATSIAPSTTSTRSAPTRWPRWRRASAGGCGDRRRPARAGGRQRAALLRPARPRRRDGSAADGPAARRGRRCAARPDDHRVRHRRAHRRGHRTPSRRHNAIGRPAVGDDDACG